MHLPAGRQEGRVCGWQLVRGPWQLPRGGSKQAITGHTNSQGSRVIGLCRRRGVCATSTSTPQQGNAWRASQCQAAPEPRTPNHGY